VRLRSNEHYDHLGQRRFAVRAQVPRLGGEPDGGDEAQGWKRSGSLACVYKRLQLELLHFNSESRRNFFPRDTTKSGGNFLLGVGGWADTQSGSHLVLRQLQMLTPGTDRRRAVDHFADYIVGDQVAVRWVDHWGITPVTSLFMPSNMRWLRRLEIGECLGS
jgi:hypothetical protein